jgi:hypothetical protein
MLGKNRGKKRVVEKKKRKRRKDKPSSDPQTPPVEALDVLITNEALVRLSALSTTAAELATPITIPRKFGWDLAPIRFPDAVEPGTVDVFLKCMMFWLSFFVIQATH